MKVLLALNSTGQFPYHESTIRELCARGHDVHVLFGFENRVSPLARVLEGPLADDALPVEHGWLGLREDRWSRLLASGRALRSYAGYLRQPAQSPYYLRRWRVYLGPRIAPLAARPAIERLLRTRAAWRALGALERLAPPAREVTAQLREIAPDVVVASPANLRDNREVEAFKAAAALRIPTVLPVGTWDNLTTKGLVHVLPDVVLAWNETQRGEAVRVQRIPADRVAVTGSAFFDPWFDRDQDVEPRAAFCARVGLDPGRPIVLYLGSSKNIAEDETWLVRELAAALRSAGDPELAGAQLVVRPHPANAHVHARLDEPGVVVWPRGGRMPDSELARRDFRASLHHCVAAVGINTSGMIDAVLAGRPCVAVLAAAYAETQRDAVHFGHLADAGALELADDAEGCARILGALLGGSDPTSEARERFVRTFVRPRGAEIPAGQVVARAVELAAERVPAAEIDRRLAALEAVA